MDYRYDHILIRYGELSLKGKNRNSFIKQLMVNVKKALKSFETLEFERQHDRMYIYHHCQILFIKICPKTRKKITK